MAVRRRLDPPARCPGHGPAGAAAHVSAAVPRYGRGADRDLAPRPQRIGGAGLTSATSGVGHERRFRDVRDESGLPSIPERLRRRSEPRLRPTFGNPRPSKIVADGRFLDHVLFSRCRAYTPHGLGRVVELGAENAAWPNRIFSSLWEACEISKNV